MQSEKSLKDQSKEDPKKDQLSRPAKREMQRLNIFLRKLMISFLQFRLSHPDKEGKEVANKFDQMEKKWIEACNMKWKSVVPKKTAFADRIEEILKEEKVKNSEQKISA